MLEQVAAGVVEWGVAVLAVVLVAVLAVVLVAVLAVVLVAVLVAVHALQQRARQGQWARAAASCCSC